MSLIHYAVGTGGHYIDWADAWVALAAMGPLQYDYEFEQISSFTMTAFPDASVAANMVQLNGHSVRFYCAWENSHQGDPTRGYVTYLSGGNGRFYCYFRAETGDSSTGQFYMENIFTEQVTATDVYLINIQIANAIVPATGTLIEAHLNNLLIKGHSTLNATGLYLSENWPVHYVSNCKIWNLKYGLYTQPTSYGSTAPLDNYTTRNVFTNISVYQTAPAIAAYGGITVRQYNVLGTRPQDFKNCYSFNATSSRSWDSSMNDAANALYNCADDDGRIDTAIAAGFTNYSAVQTNVNYTPEFESLDDTESNFLSLNRGYLSADAGATPVIGQSPLRSKFTSGLVYEYNTGLVLPNSGIIPPLVTNDIAGMRYGKYGDYPIGCHSAEVDY